VLHLGRLWATISRRDMRRKLSLNAIEDKLQSMEDWELEDGQIKKEFLVDDFVEALHFVKPWAKWQRRKTTIRTFS